jgi:hypothetical protein
MSQLVKANSGGGYEWTRLVALSGGRGRRWLEEYQGDESRAIEREALHALVLLRRAEIAAGEVLLRRAAARLDRIDPRRRSIRAVLERWYFGVLAYRHYCCERFDEATVALDRAQQAVAAAITEQRFLLPLADHCYEFQLQHARIARNRRRWAEMRQRIAAAREMMRSQLPFCRLADGSAVYWSTILAFFDSIPGLDPAERQALRETMDVDRRLRLFDQFVAGLYASPGLAIPYP